jgi:Protein of unknown function (DUF1580)
MIDPSLEAPITLRTAAKLPQLRRDGKMPHLSAMYRWCASGIRGVKLESLVIAGSRCTTSEAIDRWILALTAKAEGMSAAPERRTQIQRQRNSERADQQLAKAGW